MTGRSLDPSDPARGEMVDHATGTAAGVEHRRSWLPPAETERCVLGASGRRVDDPGPVRVDQYRLVVSQEDEPVRVTVGGDRSLDQFC